MLPNLVKRQTPARSMVYLSPLVALCLSMLAGVVLFYFMGVSPVAALRAFFVEPLATGYGVAELGVKATPLVLIGTALSLGFKAGVWNIGAEGQLTVGGLCGGAVARYFYNQDAFQCPFEYCMFSPHQLVTQVPAMVTPEDYNGILFQSKILQFR